MKKCFTLFLSPSQGIHLLFVVVINVHLLTIKLKCLSLGSVCVCLCASFFLCGVSLSNDYSTVARDVVNHGYGLNLYIICIFLLDDTQFFFCRWFS